MHIAQMIAELKFLDAKLHRSLTSGQSTSHCADLLRHSATLLSAIERHAPDSESELEQQVCFFRSRSAKGLTPEFRKRDCEIATELLNKYKDHFDFHAASKIMTARPGGTIDDRLASYVSQSVERLAAIDRRYIYLASSRPNAAFNGTHQVGMVDRHLAEVVGRARFESRASHRINKCFEGTVQEYYYSLTSKTEGERIIRCQMKPVHDEIGQLFCGLMYMTDVTDLEFPVRRSAG